MLEAEVLRSCLAYLKTIPRFKAIRHNNGGIYRGNGYSFHGEKGVSDILGWYVQEADCVIDGKTERIKFPVFTAIECKRPGKFFKPPTNEQRAFLKRVDEDGGIAMVVTSVDELKEQLAKYV